ncbi:MAG: ABC transporter permease [Spirochaetia bacterium]
MTKYFIRRFIGLIPTLWVIITISFFIIRIAPGGPFASERRVPDHVLQNLEAKYHLDEPLIMQYGRYLFNALKLDLGPSYRNFDYSVNEYIAMGLPHSLFLGILALLLALFLGVGSGMISAVKQNSIVDYLVMSLAVLGISIPLFVTAPLLQLVFAVRLRWLPTSGWFNLRQYGFETVIMPAIALMFPYFAYIARLTRASILEVLRSDYIRTARAKGLKGNVIMFKHVIKGALLPVVSYLGPAFAGIVTGSVVIEYIFRVPGMGRYFVNSAINRDYTLIMGTVIVFSVILIIMNFLVDIIYGFLDPRITYK